MMSERLIDYISEKCELYASDLLFPQNSAVILPVVSRLCPDDFSVDDWSASLSYLLRRKLRFATTAAAKDYYLKMLLANLTQN